MAGASFQNWLATDTISCFLWHDKFTWIIFVNISARYPSLNNCSLSAIFSREKKKWWCKHTHTKVLVESNSVTEELCFQTTIILWYPAEALCILPISSHRIFKFNAIWILKCIIFPAARTSLSETVRFDLMLLLWVYGGEECTVAQYSLVPLPELC